MALTKFRNRSASIRVAHGRRCPHENRTSLESLEGCKCHPTFYVFHRDGTRVVKSQRLPDLATAKAHQRETLRAITKRRFAGMAGVDAKPVAGRVDVAYGNLRRCIAELDEAKLDSPAARKHRQAALAALYDGEDALAALLRLL